MMSNGSRNQSPMLFISLIEKYLNYFINQEVAPLNFNRVQVEILGTLHFHPGITQNELGHYLLLDKIAVTKNLKPLLDRGYVQKVRDQEDRRFKKLYITSRGYSIGGDIKKVLQRANTVLLQDITPCEQEQGQAFLQKAARNIYREVHDEELKW